MKRTRIVFIGLIALLVLASVVLGACARTKYKAGTYEGASDKRAYGYETAEVTTDANKITQVVLHRRTAEGEIVDYEKYNGTGGRPDLKQYRLDLAQQMLDKQSAEVDNISGATDSVNGWVTAVKQALEKAANK